MKSINRNKIVRTITKYKGKDGKPNSYEIEFMSFSKFDSKSVYKYIDGNIEIYPYKWYDLRRIYQIPAHYFFHKLNIFFKTEINLTKTKTIAMYFTVFIMESLFAWLIVELVKFVISKI
ncbi:hypothetical protein ES677_05220 [Bizionia gelidisalsuginis]|uniref:Uncharacterized protein n=1 Tax=Bizionia gelidisalsuginis TaxID=291188 RepID=A0ABY3MBT7_9FLAO|nr:hypothetical protein [Bizionia gelidisalsuginis]TYC14782.1 hypothetical protein ES677_05220 [Bizionia gelidisalsuginis]